MDDAQPVNGSVSEGVLDFDAAVEQLSALDGERPEDEAQENTAQAEEPEADEESEAEPTAEDSEAEPDDEPTADAEDEDQPEADEEPPIQAPHSWDKEAKDWFASLDRKTQEIVASREDGRDKVVSQKLGEIAEQRKAYEEASAQIAQYTQSVAQIAEQASKVFADRWQNVDWQKLAQESPADYVRLEAQYKQESALLQQTQKAQQDAERVEYARFVQSEGEKLQQIAPDLAASPEKKQELASYLMKQGVSQENLRWASAEELSIAHKAMMYDRMSAQPAPVKPRSEKPAPKAVKPAAEAKTQPRRAKAQQSAMQRLGKTGSVDDAVAAILASES